MTLGTNRICPKAHKPLKIGIDGTATHPERDKGEPEQREAQQLEDADDAGLEGAQRAHQQRSQQNCSDAE